MPNPFDIRKQTDEGTYLPAVVGSGVSTDGSFGLPTPKGVGLELVIAGDALQNITFNGTDL